VAKEVNYFHEHQDRMDYCTARRAGEPIGVGPVEATCRQTQCRFKRPGQLRSRAGDEALLCLEMFWRNVLWLLLSPYTAFAPHEIEMRRGGRKKSKKSVDKVSASAKIPPKSGG
jgi:hypothetical protein